VTSTNVDARARRPCLSERRFVSVLATVILVASFACGDPYLHTNPYDPTVPVTITVLGLDSVFSYTEQAHFTAQIVPAFPDTAVQFSSSDNGQFQLVGSGTFEAGPRVGPPLWPATRTVTVTAGIGAFDTLRSDAGLPGGRAPTDTAWRHIGSKTVVITQRVVRILLRCPDTHACETLSAGGAWSVWVDGFDALNQKIYALTSGTANPATGTPIATFVSRDTTVASVSPVGIRAATVTARQTGMTWIVATRDVLLDSLQLVVR